MTTISSTTKYNPCPDPKHSMQNFVSYQDVRDIKMAYLTALIAGIITPEGSVAHNLSILACKNQAEAIVKFIFSSEENQKDLILAQNIYTNNKDKISHYFGELENRNVTLSNHNNFWDFNPDLKEYKEVIYHLAQMATRNLVALQGDYSNIFVGNCILQIVLHPIEDSIFLNPESWAHAVAYRIHNEDLILKVVLDQIAQLKN